MKYLLFDALSVALQTAYLTFSLIYFKIYHIIFYFNGKKENILYNIFVSLQPLLFICMVHIHIIKQFFSIKFFSKISLFYILYIIFNFNMQQGICFGFFFVVVLLWLFRIISSYTMLNLNKSKMFSFSHIVLLISVHYKKLLNGCCLVLCFFNFVRFFFQHQAYKR